MKKQSVFVDFVKIVILCLIPPLGVMIKAGIKSKHFWVNLVLTLIGYLPGLIHGVWVYSNEKENDNLLY